MPHSNKNNTGNLQIAIGFDLLESLLPNLGNLTRKRKSDGRTGKLTRLEAFLDLAMRSKNLRMKCGESTITTSIQSLSREWGWSRPTVRKFLGELKAAGAVCLPSCDGGTLVHVNNITDAPTTDDGLHR